MSSAFRQSEPTDLDRVKSTISSEESRRLLHDRPLVCLPLQLRIRDDAIILRVMRGPIWPAMIFIAIACAGMYWVFHTHVLPTVHHVWSHVVSGFFVFVVVATGFGGTLMNRRARRFGSVCSLSTTPPMLSLRNGADKVRIDNSRPVILVHGRTRTRKRFREDSTPKVYVHCYTFDETGEPYCAFSLVGNHFFGLRAITGEHILHRFFTEAGFDTRTIEVDREHWLFEDDIDQAIAKHWLFARQ